MSTTPEEPAPEGYYAAVIPTVVKGSGALQLIFHKWKSASGNRQPNNRQTVWLKAADIAAVQDAINRLVISPEGKILRLEEPK